MKRKNGRPRIKIDYNLVYRLAKRFDTQEGIAEILECSASKLQHDKNFLQAFKKGKELCFKNLRIAQYKHALKGNPALLIWLGKNYLNQKEPQFEQANTENIDERLKAIAEAVRGKWADK